MTFIRQVTRPDDCLITDYAQLLYWTDRLPPPILAEVTSNRLKSGHLTTAQLITITEVEGCPIVAPLTGRFQRSTPAYLDWVEEHYAGRFVYDEGSEIIFFGKPLDRAFVLNTARSHQVHFYDNKTVQDHLPGLLELVAAKSGPTRIQANQSLPLTLFWVVHEKIEIDYTIFVQLRNQDNAVVAGADHQPYQQLLPFSQWPISQILAETVWLDLPPDLPLGEYTLFVGLYDQRTLERLAIWQDQSGENAVHLLKLSTQD